MKNSDFRKTKILEMSCWSLEKKIEHAKKRIVEFYEKQDGKVYVAFSGGKDSTVLLHLVRSIYPDVVAVFSNTTNEYVEILKFVRTIDNLIELKPKIDFKGTIEKYGFPIIGKKVARQISDLKNPTKKNIASRNLYLTGIKRDGTKTKSFKLAKRWHKLIDAPFNITNKCCDILKKDPMKKFEKETGLYPFIGTQVNESTQRKQSWIQTGCNSYDGKDIKSRPLSIWNENDIWEYIKKYDIPYCEIYDDVVDEFGNILIEGEKRTGCAYCAFGIQYEKSDLINKNRFDRLKIRKPKQYEKIMSLKNNDITYREALNFIGFFV